MICCSCELPHRFFFSFIAQLFLSLAYFTREGKLVLDELEPVEIEFQLEKPKEENIVVRLQKPIKEQLERMARRKGLNISSLTRMWIMEKLQSAHP
jgi:hypothetical protein